MTRRPKDPVPRHEGSDRLLGAACGAAPFDDVYRTIFALSGVGMFQSTPAGYYLKANPALAGILGYPSADSLIDEVEDIAREFYVEPGRRTAFMQALDVEDRISGFVSRIRRRDGRMIWVSETATAVRDAAGGLCYYIGTLEDITDRIHAEEALQSALRSYRDLFTNASEGIYRTSPAGRLLRANPALVKMMGYDSEAALIGAIEEIGGEIYVDPRRRTDFMREIQKTGRVENFVSEAYRHRTRERIWITENARAVYGAEGDTLYYEGTLQDITERKETEQALLAARVAAEEANRAKTEFLASMSHELRTPLNAIIGFSEMMEREVAGPLGSERYLGYVHDIRISGVMLLQLLNDILDLVKVEAGKLELMEHAVDCVAVAEECLRMLSAPAGARQITLECRASRRPLSLMGDERRLRQVVLNLTSNAVKYNRQGGHLLVDIHEADDGQLVLAVEDDGPGIPEDQRERVFEPFVQLPCDNGTVREGVGLGLPLCRQLVDLHGGFLRIDDAPGGGARVEARFPAKRVVPPGEGDGPKGA